MFTGASKTIQSESDPAWIDIKSRWNDGDPSGWDWINNGKEFLAIREKMAWRHIYKIDMNGKGNINYKRCFDVIKKPEFFDVSNKLIIFRLHPKNADSGIFI